MGKTFEEWFRENRKELEDLEVCIVFDYGNDAYLTDSSLEEIAKLAWNASRENMTWRDI